MQRNVFHYELPNELIAQVPLEQRNQSKLFVCNAPQNSLSDSTFVELPHVLEQQFQLKKNNSRVLLIANNSRVYQARVRVRRKTGAKGEVFLLETGNQENYSCLLKPKGKLTSNEILYAFDDPNAPLFQITSVYPSQVKLATDLSCNELIEKYGEMPLPPYIKRNFKNEEDKQRYQTVYSELKNAGSAAAPTAGLHFTAETMEQCQKMGADFAFVTLNVGLGTFLPVKTDNIVDHQMHEESYVIENDLIEKICLFLKNEWPIVFVGTTSLRAVESFLRIFFKPGDRNKILELAKLDQLESILKQQAGKKLSTNLFLYPKNENDRVIPCIGNGILTNFHQSESTLAMLIASLVGIPFWKHMYATAIEKKYRFLSYGDSSLILF